MQIAPSYKQSKGISEAQKINFAKHNEALKNLPHAYKKNVYQLVRFFRAKCGKSRQFRDK